MAEISELRKQFGQRIKAQRRQKGWTQKELGAQLGVNYQQVNKYEAGLHSPPFEKLVELAELFETSIDYLVTGNQSAPRPLHHIRLWERFRTLEGLDHDDQESVIKVVDALIVQCQTDKFRRERERKPRRARG
jgi:transcriptional regulator with XRE-family HTH domain